MGECLEEGEELNITQGMQIPCVDISQFIDRQHEHAEDQIGLSSLLSSLFTISISCFKMMLMQS